MRILVISDTHGDLERFWKVFEKLNRENPVQMIVHCGDYFEDGNAIRKSSGLPVIAVMGNCDGELSEKSYGRLETEAGDFLVCHGHMENVDLGLQSLYYKALEANCIGALFGHTHQNTYVEVDGLYIMNPGSLPKPKDGSGGTFGIIQTSESGVWGKIYNYKDFIVDDNDSNPSCPPNKKTKVTGGHLKSLLNHSDRF